MDNSTNLKSTRREQMCNPYNLDKYECCLNSNRRKILGDINFKKVLKFSPITGQGNSGIRYKRTFYTFRSSQICRKDKKKLCPGSSLNYYLIPNYIQNDSKAFKQLTSKAIVLLENPVSSTRVPGSNNNILRNEACNEKSSERNNKDYSNSNFSTLFDQSIKTIDTIHDKLEDSKRFSKQNIKTNCTALSSNNILIPNYIQKNSKTFKQLTSNVVVLIDVMMAHLSRREPNSNTNILSNQVHYKESSNGNIKGCSCCKCIKRSVHSRNTIDGVRDKLERIRNSTCDSKKVVPKLDKQCIKQNCSKTSSNNIFIPNYITKGSKACKQLNSNAVVLIEPMMPHLSTRKPNCNSNISSNQIQYKKSINGNNKGSSCCKCIKQLVHSTNTIDGVHNKLEWLRNSTCDSIKVVPKLKKQGTKQNCSVTNLNNIFIPNYIKKGSEVYKQLASNAIVLIEGMTPHLSRVEPNSNSNTSSNKVKYTKSRYGNNDDYSWDKSTEPLIQNINIINKVNDKLEISDDSVRVLKQIMKNLNEQNVKNTSYAISTSNNSFHPHYIKNGCEDTFNARVLNDILVEKHDSGMKEPNNNINILSDAVYCEKYSDGNNENCNRGEMPICTLAQGLRVIDKEKSNNKLELVNNNAKDVIKLISHSKNTLVLRPSSEILNTEIIKIQEQDARQEVYEKQVEKDIKTLLFSDLFKNRMKSQHVTNKKKYGPLVTKTMNNVQMTDADDAKTGRDDCFRGFFAATSITEEEITQEDNFKGFCAEDRKENLLNLSSRIVQHSKTYSNPLGNFNKIETPMKLREHEHMRLPKERTQEDVPLKQDKLKSKLATNKRIMPYRKEHKLASKNVYSYVKRAKQDGGSKRVRMFQPTNDDDYGLEHMYTDASSEDEMNPKKAIPNWALAINRRCFEENVQKFIPTSAWKKFMTNKVPCLEDFFTPSQMPKKKMDRITWNLPIQL